MADRRSERLSNKASLAAGAAETMTQRIPIKRLAKKSKLAGAAAETMTERIPIKRLAKKRAP